MRQALLVATLACAEGCVDDHPIVSGKRDAATVSRLAVVPKSDDPDVDFPTCEHCAKMMDPAAERNVLCRKNATPSSAVLLNTLVRCVCSDKCIEPCTTYCAGSLQTSTCQQCVLANCSDDVSSCMADTGQ